MSQRLQDYLVKRHERSKAEEEVKKILSYLESVLAALSRDGWKKTPLSVGRSFAIRDGMSARSSPLNLTQWPDRDTLFRTISAWHDANEAVNLILLSMTPEEKEMAEGVGAVAAT